MGPRCLKANHFQNCIIRSHSNEILKQFERIFRHQRTGDFIIFFWYLLYFSFSFHSAIESSGLLTSWINSFSFLLYAEAICIIVSLSLFIFILQLTETQFGSRLPACMCSKFSAVQVLMGIWCCNYDLQLLILQHVA